MTEVPVHVARDLTPAQIRGLRLADNRTNQEASWDEELLALELLDLKDLDFNLGLIGFEDEELARLLAAQDAAEGLTDEDAAPDLPETPISLAGDLWILGSHKLLVGDATNQDDVARLMSGDSADLVFTDPPYNVSYEGYTEDRLTIKGDRMSDADFKQFLEAAFRSYRALVKPGASMYVCHSSSWQREFQNALAAISSSTSLCSMPTSPAKKIPGTATSPSPPFGKRRSPPRTGFTRPQSRWNSSSGR